MSNITPTPAGDLRLSMYTLAANKQIHRVHLSQYGPAQLNPGLKGNARFSPITNANSKAIPTMYAGTTFDCALMETVFHDVPHTADLKTIGKSTFRNQIHSQLTVLQDLNLVDLSSVAMRKLGLTRSQLIDTEKDSYPSTRLWAKAIHLQCPAAQGMTWVSRQDDRARAFMFFGDRLPARPFEAGYSNSLVGDKTTYMAVLDLAELIGVEIVQL